MEGRGMVRIVAAVVVWLGLLVAGAEARPLDAPRAHAASVCADYPNQAAAQRAHDTRDPDHDGIYCEDLPCPCLNPGDGAPAPTATPTPTPAQSQSEPNCTRPSAVRSISFSGTKYPNIKRHAERAIRKGWPKVLVLNRPGADGRRDRLLAGWVPRPGYDRDEYPPAVGRGRGTG